jgi:uncharacterized membrane protein
MANRQRKRGGTPMTIQPLALLWNSAVIMGWRSIPAHKNQPAGPFLPAGWISKGSGANNQLTPRTVCGDDCLFGEILMTRRFVRAIAILLFLSAVVVSAVAQQTTTNPLAPPPASPANQAPPPKPPDMVCWGSGPNWSIQFVSWGARYLGINQPDQDFLGGFFWVPDQKVWVWQRKNNLAPVSGYALSATITKASCTDSLRKETFPWSAQVNLPEGDMVNGCCRKLKPGEAPVGPHGLPAQPSQQ